MIIAFQVVHRGERAAGIRPYEQEIQVNIVNEVHAGIEKEMTEELRTFFAEWYDGAKVYTKAEWDKIIEDQNRDYNLEKKL